MRIFSGIQPSGDPHIGNYSGRLPAVRPDAGAGRGLLLHRRPARDHRSSTIPAALREGTLDIAAMLFATGLDPSARRLRAEPRHRARRGGLAAVVGRELRPARPDDAVQGEGAEEEFVSAALFTYPVLMAGDILLYQTDIVPIGDDQRQHLELSRDIAQRFNSATARRSSSRRRLPRDRRRVMNLQEPT
jgi:tryptophanyl-tRNA synthetase